MQKRFIQFLLSSAGLARRLSIKYVNLAEKFKDLSQKLQDFCIRIEGVKELLVLRF